MDMHYCDIFSDCYRCPVPFCPYEKLDDWGQDVQDETDEEDLDEDEEEGW
jgi:hypothetical protein